VHWALGIIPLETNSAFNLNLYKKDWFPSYISMLVIDIL
jgi:hypothetical protein